MCTLPILCKLKEAGPILVCRLIPNRFLILTEVPKPKCTQHYLVLAQIPSHNLNPYPCLPPKPWCSQESRPMCRDFFFEHVTIFKKNNSYCQDIFVYLLYVSTSQIPNSKNFEWRERISHLSPSLWLLWLGEGEIKFVRNDLLLIFLYPNPNLNPIIGRDVLGRGLSQLSFHWHSGQ